MGGYEDSDNGDGVGMGTAYVGLGWEWGQFHVDMVGRGCKFRTTSHFSE